MWWIVTFSMARNSACCFNDYHVSVGVRVYLCKHTQTHREWERQRASRTGSHTHSNSLLAMTCYSMDEKCLLNSIYNINAYFLLAHFFLSNLNHINTYYICVLFSPLKCNENELVHKLFIHTIKYCRWITARIMKWMSERIFYHEAFRAEHH